MRILANRNKIFDFSSDKVWYRFNLTFGKNCTKKKKNARKHVSVSIYNTCTVTPTPIFHTIINSRTSCTVIVLRNFKY